LSGYRGPSTPAAKKAASAQDDNGSMLLPKAKSQERKEFSKGHNGKDIEYRQVEQETQVLSPAA
jgi:hypothetical protein